MCATNEFQAVDMVEQCRDLGTKHPTGSTLRRSPLFNILGIGPHEVAKGTLVRDFLVAVEQADLIDRGEARGKAAVDAEDPVVDDCREG